MSVALRLLSERVDNVLLSWTIRIVPLLLCCGVSFLLYEHIMEYRRLAIPLCISLPVAVLVFFFTCLFLRRENDLQFCKFVGNVFKSLGLSAISGAVFFALSILLLLIFRWLAGSFLDDTWYDTWREFTGYALFFLVLPLVMLSHINSRAEIDSPKSANPKKNCGGNII